MGMLFLGVAGMLPRDELRLAGELRDSLIPSFCTELRSCATGAGAGRSCPLAALRSWACCRLRSFSASVSLGHGRGRRQERCALVREPGASPGAEHDVVGAQLAKHLAKPLHLCVERRAVLAWWCRRPVVAPVGEAQGARSRAWGVRHHGAPGAQLRDVVRRGEQVRDPRAACLLYTSPSPRDRG